MNTIDRNNNRNNNRNNKETFKSGQLKEIIFATIGISVLIGGTVLITPNFPIVLSSLLKLIEEFKGLKIENKKKIRHKVKRALKRLEKRKLISLEKKGEEVEVKVLEDGREEVLKYSIKQLLKLKKENKNWNKKWFIVIFDVPESERNKRDYLRNFLTTIGFQPYQQSVYIYPFECKKEINLIKKMVEGGKYISYFVADEIEEERLFKKLFKI